MNVNDVTQLPEVGPNDDRLCLMFERQHELATKYLPIEEMNGVALTTAFPVDLHDRKGQTRLKLFAWYVSEEVAEALDAICEKRDVTHTHVHEELADGLHFLIEMGLLSGINPGDFETLTDSDRLDVLVFEACPHHASLVGLAASDFLHDLGMTCHLLKNKAWKQSHMLTDLAEYRTRYARAFQSYINLCVTCKMDAQSIFELYFRKSEVNKFRIQSQY